MQLRGAHGAQALAAGVAAGGTAGAGYPVAGGGHLGRGDAGDPVPGHPHAHTEVQGVVRGRQGQVEAVQLLPDEMTHQHSTGAHSEHVAHAVVLTLVEFALHQGDGRAAVRQGLPELVDVIAGIPVHDLRAGDGDGWRNLQFAQQRRQCTGFGRTVLGEEPQHFAVGLGRRDHLHSRGDDFAEMESGSR